VGQCKCTVDATFRLGSVARLKTAAPLRAPLQATSPWTSKIHTPGRITPVYYGTLTTAALFCSAGYIPMDTETLLRSKGLVSGLQPADNRLL